MTHSNSTQPTFSLREQLKTLTKPFHDQLENTVLARSLADGSVSRDRYERYLGHLLTLHSVIEEKIRHYPQWKEYNLDITQRVRYPLLQSDLTSLNAPESAASLPPLAVSWSFATAVGVMYVLEGSTMGGIFLAQRLSHLLGDDGLPATRYFQGYGELTMPRWGEYCTFLERFSLQEPKSHEEVILAACAMFLLMQKVMNELD
jgi:heme oxygenase